MYIQMEDFKTGWFGITLGVNENDIDNLIERLTILKERNEEFDHFHLSRNENNSEGIFDIEIYLQADDDENDDNMVFL